MKVFLVRNNHANSWTGTTTIYPNVFATKRGARAFVGEVSPVWADNDEEVEPYYTILEVTVEDSL